MSLEAMLWALRLPPERRTHIAESAHLTLIELSNYADPQGRGAFPSTATLAAQRSVSQRTIMRHLKALRNAGLIGPGDQRHVQHIEGDRRPVVYDLIMVDEPVDNSPERGDIRVTPLVPRGDTKGGYGVTPGVTQSVNKPTSESYVLNSPRHEKLSTGDRYPDAVATDTEHDDSAGECIHGFSAGVSARTGQPWCPTCRRRGYIVHMPAANDSQETANV